MATDAVLAPLDAILAMREILVASTGMGREAAGICAVREATRAEIDASGLSVERAWWVDEFRTLDTGGMLHVAMPQTGPGELAWHTHPGLKFSMAGFSDQDFDAVRITHQPLMVIGYTAIAPDSISLMGIAGGWYGMAAVAAVQAALRLEARGKLPTSFLQMGVAARVAFPGGRVLPVRRAEATPVRRAVETATFGVDQAAMTVANAANRAFFKLVGWDSE